MNISAANNTSIYSKLLAYGFNNKTIGSANFAVPEFEPIEPITKISSKDKLNIDFDKIAAYKSEVDKLEASAPIIISKPAKEHKETTADEKSSENNKIDNKFLSANIKNNNKNDTNETNEPAVNNNFFSANIKNNTKNNTNELSEEQQKIVRNLEERDKEVRHHEQAHISAGGSLVRGGASFSYTIGPDGKQYATSGEVNIDMSVDENNPAATISKMQKVVSAAMAPAEPSAQDFSVAATARKNEAEARRHLSVEHLSIEANSNEANSNTNSVTQKTNANSVTDTDTNTNTFVAAKDSSNQNQSNNTPTTSAHETAKQLINTYIKNKNYDSQTIGSLSNFIV